MTHYDYDNRPSRARALKENAALESAIRADNSTNLHIKNVMLLCCLQDRAVLKKERADWKKRKELSTAELWATYDAYMHQ